jgi:hypothetical protein
MLLAWVSTIDSMTSLPLLLRTAITTASLCTSMPIYLRSRLISCLLEGKIIRVQRSLSLKVKCHSSADLPIFSSDSCPPPPRHTHSTGPPSHNALTKSKRVIACSERLWFREAKNHRMMGRSRTDRAIKGSASNRASKIDNYLLDNISIRRNWIVRSMTKRDAELGF